ncbi:DNA cytosine methyltransferase [Shewanella indica]|uniref:DNA (cytosine-5-)-methyltransferase n=1 Tax=Shewanella indica TaxID=768528 RepID=A0ABU4QJ95_9GAMM|nr:DNA cytosine methyltransferase [Shewanella indica]MDX6018605.1 DNA cytosine methyltransferase [Shewanella indica]MDX6018668.1 DNA cytosine methyltransferase [Shewanella indica]
MGNFYEFFAGGGMARAGLGSEWDCLFANDFDSKKAASYAANWGADHLRVGDVAALTTDDLPGHADLAWASFPCQDLSLAGAGAGLKGDRSGTFWPFWKLMKALDDEDRAPHMVVLENVYGALSSHEGKDFAAICSALAGAGYRFGAVIVNAVKFLPQSRPRLFIIAVKKPVTIPRELITEKPGTEWHPAALIDAYKKLPKRSKNSWVWWQMPSPPARSSIFADLVEDKPQGVTWHTAAETKKLLTMMSPLNLAKVDAAKKADCRMVGTIYKRTRANGVNGEKVQRAEIRFDDIAGCLRTPSGGSSRQTIMVIKGKRVRSRLLSPREAARLMGLPDTYLLPKNYNEAYHLAGDGVAVPVVRFLAENILEPMLSAALTAAKKAA